jgi:hypothetical protein
MANGEWRMGFTIRHWPFATRPNAGIANSTHGRNALADVHLPASRSCPGDRADHVRGGGSFPRAVWMARTIVEAGAEVNCWAAPPAAGPNEAGTSSRCRRASRRCCCSDRWVSARGQEVSGTTMTGWPCPDRANACRQHAFLSVARPSRGNLRDDLEGALSPAWADLQLDPLFAAPVAVTATGLAPPVALAFLPTPVIRHDP